MAVNNEYPVLDGIAPSWADLSVKLTGADITLLEMRDIKAINTGRSVEVGAQRGATGGRKKKRTTGQADEEASWTLYRDGFQRMLRTLKAAAESKGYVRGNEVLISLVHFDIIWFMTPPGDPDIYERRVYGARVIGDTMNSAEGSDAQEVEVPLSVAKIADIIDGKEIVLL
jgi:hypothetical protein